MCSIFYDVVALLMHFRSAAFDAEISIFWH
jgi:hypothetical protein